MKMQGTKHRSMSTEWFGKRQDLLLYTANFFFSECVILYTFFSPKFRGQIKEDI
jgi:hypothetical protein